MAKTVYKTESGANVFGLLAEFANPHTLSEGAKKVRDAGYQKWDTHAPFPVHEMEESMGIVGKAIAPMMFVIGCAAICGAVLVAAHWWRIARWHVGLLARAAARAAIDASAGG